MNNKCRIVIAVIVFAAIIAFVGIRAFQPSVPLAKLKLVRPGMSYSQVREILGPPTTVYPGTVQPGGTNRALDRQWTYERWLTFGYINVLFDTNGSVEYGHYEQF